jgi:hypothetical protein
MIYITSNAERRMLNAEPQVSGVGRDRRARRGLEKYPCIIPGFRVYRLNLSSNGLLSGRAFDVQRSAFSVQRWGCI